mmetsp:Transcript_82991/g.234410  ORF Transcript_82991/g.234410 Transcript_82991/m.234410 type:complete len:156 (+) Transcript_82991:59-526(+)
MAGNALRHFARAGAGLTTAGVARSVILRGGGGGGPPPPPFARTLVPEGPLHEEHELIWDDGVAAETTLDFDAPHISKWEGLAWWFGGFGFFFGVYTFATVTDAIVPSFQNKAAARGPTLPFGGLYTELGSHGKKPSMSPDTEEEHEDEDEDEDDE